MPGRAVGTQRLSILDEAQALNFFKHIELIIYRIFLNILYLYTMRSLLLTFLKSQLSGISFRVRQYYMFGRLNFSIFQFFGDEVK